MADYLFGLLRVVPDGQQQKTKNDSQVAHSAASSKPFRSAAMSSFDSRPLSNRRSVSLPMNRPVLSSVDDMSSSWPVSKLLPSRSASTASAMEKVLPGTRQPYFSFSF